jgi:hypothetical protein
MAIYGQGGVGKTFLASYAEDPMYIGLESGTNLVPAKKFNVKPKCIDDVYEMIRYVIKYPDSCKTVVIDSLGFFQSMVYADILKKNPSTGGKDPKPVNGIIDYPFHSGYAMALPYWEKLMVAIDALQSKGKNVILITHSQLKNATTEGGESYKVTDFALQSPNNGDVCELLRRRLDICLFVESTAKTRKKSGGFSGSTTLPMVGSRPDVTVYTRATSRFFAKCRSIDETKVNDSYTIDSDNIDESSRAIFKATVGF